MKAVALSLISVVLTLAIACSDDTNPSRDANQTHVDSSADSGPDGSGRDARSADVADTGFDEDLGVDTTPCEWGPESWVEGDVVAIDCQLDLAQESVDIPARVTLEYAGGEIINGTLSFESEGVIDGRLLNYTLAIEGDATLQNPEFFFYPARWQITQGPVSDADALLNRQRLNELIALVKRLDGGTFRTGQFDAYFKVDVPRSEAHVEDFALSLPSHFSLVMSDETHLRTQPNGNPKSALLAISNENSEVTVRGGNIHGDRDEHDYSTGDSTHEWGHGLLLRGCFDVTIDGVTVVDAGGDGISISNLGRADRSNYRPSYLVKVLNSTIVRARRNGLSVGGAHDLVIEGNDFVATGVDTPNSEGTNPRFAIDIEAYNDEAVTQLAEDIVVRGNTERGGARGGFIAAIGDRVIFEENHMELGIAISNSNNSIIRNNTFVSATGDGLAIKAGKLSLHDRTQGTRVYGNSITGYEQGVYASTLDVEVHDNTITDCKKGISLDDLRNSRVYDNTIVSDVDGSDGISTRYGGGDPRQYYLDGVEVSGNVVDVRRTPISVRNINQRDGQEDYEVTFEDNQITSPQTSSIENTQGFRFRGNTIAEGGLRLTEVESSDFVNNKITSTGTSGIRLDEGCRDLSIKDNQISVDEPHQCIEHRADDGVDITETGNTCN
jgi:parallel beta-helix repeat protein